MVYKYGEYCGTYMVYNHAFQVTKSDRDLLLPSWQTIFLIVFSEMFHTDKRGECSDKRGERGKMYSSWKSTKKNSAAEFLEQCQLFLAKQHIIISECY